MGTHNEAIATVTSEECDKRASYCAANAGASVDQTVAKEFLKMAAQWRMLAVRTVFLGSMEAMVEAPLPGAPKPGPI